jgi:hypothetical protein
MTLLDHRNTATTKKLDFKNSHLTSVGAILRGGKYQKKIACVGVGALSVVEMFVSAWAWWRVEVY